MRFFCHRFQIEWKSRAFWTIQAYRCGIGSLVSSVTWNFHEVYHDKILIQSYKVANISLFTKFSCVFVSTIQWCEGKCSRSLWHFKWKGIYFWFEPLFFTWHCYPRAARWTLISFEFCVCIMFSTQTTRKLESLVPTQMVSYLLWSVRVVSSMCLTIEAIKWGILKFLVSTRYTRTMVRPTGRYFLYFFWIGSKRFSSKQMDLLSFTKPILRK